MAGEDSRMDCRRSYCVLAVVAAAFAVFGVMYGRSAAAAGAMSTPGIAYVAVGDSYTIGTGTTPGQSWPALLTAHLQAKRVPITLVGNLGHDGFTTDQAMTFELPEYSSDHPTFATLMIGVNDTYRSTTPDQFRAELRSLLDSMQAGLPDKRRIVMVTIPDYSVTPAGSHYAAMNGAGGKIASFNAILKDEAARRGLPIVDVTPLSRHMASDPTLVASDHLHPSAKEYAIWEKAVFPVVYRMLKRR